MNHLIQRHHIPKVSVLMPALNAEKYIELAVKSILNQTLFDLELIIIDDGSKDKTWEIMNSLKKLDKRIRIYRNKKNEGVFYTRNLLIKRARGEFIAWMDADDVSTITRLERQYKAMSKNKKLGIIGGYLKFIDECGKTITVRSYDTSHKKLMSKIFLFSPVSQGAAMIRKSVYSKTGGYRQGLRQAEDLDMVMRIAKDYQISNLKEVVLLCRYHSQSLSTGKMKQNILSTLAVRKYAVTHYGYTMNIVDKTAMFGTQLVLLLPTNMIFWLFNKIRKP